MSGPSLPRLLAADLRRRRTLLAGGAVGVALAMGLTVFLAALGLGLRGAVLSAMFPFDRLEVAPRPLELGLWVLKVDLGSDAIRPAQLERLAELPGVDAVHERSVLTVPGLARGGGPILGAGFRTEIVADGLPEGAVAGDLPEGVRFLDPEQAGSSPVPCRSDSDCPPPEWCRGGNRREDGECRAPVPVVVSRNLAELYDGVLRRAFQLPKLDLEKARGIQLWVRFGESWFDRRTTGAAPVDEKIQVAGFSDLAVPLGVTMPLETVRRLNTRFAGEREGRAVHGAVLDLASAADAPRIMAAVEELGLEVSDRGARRASALTAVLLAGLVTVGGAVLVVAVLAVGHLFALLALVRRREIGVWRVAGARPWQLLAVLAGQGALVGAVAGAVGAGTARLLGVAVDAAVGRALPMIDLLPETVFAGWWGLAAAAVVVGAAASALGAAIPSWSLVRVEPAALLRD